MLSTVGGVPYPLAWGFGEFVIALGVRGGIFHRSVALDGEVCWSRMVCIEVFSH